MRYFCRIGAVVIMLAGRKRMFVARIVFQILMVTLVAFRAFISFHLVVQKDSIINSEYFDWKLFAYAFFLTNLNAILNGLYLE